jgi:transposase
VTTQELETALARAEGANAQLRRDVLLRDAQIRRLEQLLAELARRHAEPLPASLELSLADPAAPGPAPLFEPPHEASPAPESPSAAEAEPAPPPKKPRRGHGRTPQPGLRVVTLVGELDEPDRTCPACGGHLVPMPGQVESSEVIDVRPREYVLVKVERQKYRCGCGACVDTALPPEDAPERAVESGRYSFAVAAEVVVDKYADHLPLERQTRIMRRRGLSVTSQALWDLVWAMAALLGPAAAAVRKSVLAAAAVGVDTTSWKNLKAKDANPFQLWCVRANNAVFFDVRRDKSAASFKILLGEFAGWISADMAGTNLAGVTAAQAGRLTGCWSHVFRKFRDALKNHPAAEPMCQLIGKLFDIESQKYASVAERLQARQANAKPVLIKIKALLQAYRSANVTSLDKAMGYLGDYWPYLERYVDSGDAWICNNPTERGLRGPVVGRRNHFGSKSDRGREAAGTLYTLVETAKLLGLDPADYLVAAAKAARRGEVLTPAMYAALPSAGEPTT